MASTRAFRRPAAGASLVLLALLACQVDLGEFELDLDFGDASFFGVDECQSDEDCGAGRCCSSGLLSAKSCKDRIEIDPARPCSILTDDQLALCMCHAPGTPPLCPGWLVDEPDSPNCGAHPYARCVALCEDSLCACETEDTGLLGDAGIVVRSCAPEDWALECSDAGTSDAQLE